MGEMKSFTIGSAEMKCCCGDAIDYGCCGSESITFEDGINDELFASFSFLFDNAYFTTLDYSYKTILIEDAHQSSLYVSENLPPPKGVDLYLQNCSFIYYG